MIDIKQVLLLCFINFLIKKSTSLACKSTKVAMLQSEQLAEELHKPIIKKFKKEEFILLLRTVFGMLI